MGGGGSVPQAGLTPLQQGQSVIGRDMIGSNQGQVDRAGGALLRAEEAANAMMPLQSRLLALQDQHMASMDALEKRQAAWDQSQAAWARGGLLRSGLAQVNQALDQTPDAMGMQSRAMGRLGLQASAEQAGRLQQEQSLGQTANKVGLANAARAGLANAQRDMRFGGL